VRPDELVGNKRKRQGLLRAAASGRLAHAYLFCGPEGVGKRSLALALSQMLACRSDDPPCGSCRVCREIAAGTYPDLHVLSPRGRLGVIKVEGVRLLVEALSRRSTADVGPFVIIDGADRMGQQAANALLKTLEEPPPGSLIVLVASRPDRLLPTVRSRCVRVDFGPVASGDIEEMLIGRGIEPTEARERAFSARGSPGRALELTPEDIERRRSLLALLPRLGFGAVPLALEAAAALDSELRDARDAEEAQLADASAGFDPQEREELKGVAAEDAAARMKERVAGLFELLLSWCREVAAASCGAPASDPEVREAAGAARPGPVAPARLGERIAEAAESAAGTGQLRLCLEAALLSICVSGGDVEVL